MIILSKVLKESNQIKILAIRVAAKRTLDNALLLIREFIKTCDNFSEEVGINIAAVNKQLKTMTSKGYIQRVEKDDTWRLIITPSV